MKNIKITLTILMILIASTLSSGCWNYKEIEDLSIVAGAAIDKEPGGLYKITVEIVDISGGKDPKITPETVSMEGVTMFDAVRNGISAVGKKLYWSHAKIIILSEKVASEGAVNIIDWYNRDSETRADVHILISREDSAKKIFIGEGITEEIKSFALDYIMENQTSLSKAPLIDLLQFDNDLQAEGVSAIAPAVKIKKVDEKVVPYIAGTAIFKKGKLVGFLDAEETKYLLFIRNEIKGGLLVEGGKEEGTVPASLEIFKSKTKITPYVGGEEIIMNINIETETALDEINGTENLIDDEGRKKLEHRAEKSLEKQIEGLIEKVQSNYAADIFGFGVKLREDKNEAWKKVRDNWEETFKNIKVNVTAKVQIKNSSLLSKPLQEGE